jgi:hypothetical protein
VFGIQLGLGDAAMLAAVVGYGANGTAADTDLTAITPVADRAVKPIRLRPVC